MHMHEEPGRALPGQGGAGASEVGDRPLPFLGAALPQAPAFLGARVLASGRGCLWALAMLGAP